MLLLGLETSCDETSAAVVENGTTVRSCVISSSRKDFESVGGVIPEEAARRQLEVILPVIEKGLQDAGVAFSDLDAIAVTVEPGLLGSLLVGTATARTLSSAYGKPIIPVHHTLGHLSSVWLDAKDEPRFPVVTLSVSGGHSDLWYRESHTKGQLIGTTRDDAAGEAFDKGAVLLGLPYPGGPALAKLAETGDEKRFDFPQPLRGDSFSGFSFSGLKTSLKYLLRDLGEIVPDAATKADIAACYQLAICRHLAEKTEQALRAFADATELHIVGGVSANTRLRTMMKDVGDKHGIAVRWPSSLRYCTDNGAMIAAAGEFLLRERPEMLGAHFQTQATASLGEIFRRKP